MGLVACWHGATPVLRKPWVTFAGVAHLLAIAQQGEGTYESTAAVLAWTYSVPLVVL